MLPTHQIHGSTSLPAGATFWTPDPGDLGDEGFGFFHDTWTILGVSPGDAAQQIRQERDAADLIDSLSSDEGEFELLARAVEEGDEDGLLTATQAAALEAHIPGDEGPSSFDGLELGVAGLVHALSAAGMFPAASCRGHAAPDAWSQAPVVFLAADQQQARALEPLMAATGCLFSADANRSEMLVICGRSIRDTMRLADLVISHRAGLSRGPAVRDKPSAGPHDRQ